MKTATVCGVTAEGTTVKEAKEKIHETLDRFVKDTDGGPWVLKLGPLVGIIFPEVVRSQSKIIYEYMLFNPETVQIGRNNFVRAGFNSHESMYLAERHMRVNAAQLLFDHGEDDPFGILNSIRVAPEDREAHAKWCNWQRQYKKLEKQGKSDDEIRKEMFASGY